MISPDQINFLVNLVVSLLGNLLCLPVNCLISIATTFLGVTFALAIERNKRPMLWMEKGQTRTNEGDNTGDPICKYLHLNIWNRKLSAPLSWFGSRDPAVACRAWITFYRGDLSRVFEINARWASIPSPDIPKYLLERELPKGVQETVTIQPGRFEELDIAVKFKADNVCNAWNNENYLYREPKDPKDKYHHPNRKLEPGDYYVHVIVQTGGREFPDWFKLHNADTYAEVDEPQSISDEEKRNLNKLLTERPSMKTLSPS
jgi:hypothetical protein